MPTILESVAGTHQASEAFQGKSKQLQAGKAPNTLLVTFKNDATAFNGEKHAVFEGKGALNKAFTQQFFELFDEAGIPTCWLQSGDTPDTAIYRVLTMIPVEVVVRNVAQGSLCKRLGMAENTVLKAPLVEYFLKNDALGDPAIPPSAIAEMGLLPEGVQLKQLEWMALAVNTILSARFKAAGVTLVDFKLEMGLDSEGILRLGDELSPDGCRLQDTATGQSLDKDVFRKGTGDLIETYQTLANKLAKAPWDLSQLPAQIYTGVVVVQSRANILNPQSRTLTHALQQTFIPDASIPTGAGGILRVDSQKRFEVSITATDHWQALALLNQLAEEPLSNPVIEDAMVTEINLAKEAN